MFVGMIDTRTGIWPPPWALPWAQLPFPSSELRGLSGTLTLYSFTTLGSCRCYSRSVVWCWPLLALGLHCGCGWNHPTVSLCWAPAWASQDRVLGAGLLLKGPKRCSQTSARGQPAPSGSKIRFRSGGGTFRHRCFCPGTLREGLPSPGTHLDTLTPWAVLLWPLRS